MQMMAPVDDLEEIEESRLKRFSLDYCCDSLCRADLKKNGGGMSQAQLDTLLSWLEGNGGCLKGIEVTGDGPRRGMRASRAIERGEVVLAVPSSCLLTVQMAMETTVGKKLRAYAHKFESPSHIFLAVLLLLDKANNNISGA
jgi:hypothetical protein